MIYELSKFAAETMMTAANGDSRVFAVIESRPEDSIERQARLNTEGEEITELIALKLLHDVSDKFVEQIAICKVNKGFGYRVVALTELGSLMFCKTDKDLIN